MDIRLEIRRAVPKFRRQFDGGRKPILDRELAAVMIFYDGMALSGPSGAAALDALRAMPEREAEDLILEVMKEMT